MKALKAIGVAAAMLAAALMTGGPAAAVSPATMLASPAGTAANPVSPAGTSTASEQERLGADRAAAWDCAPGYSCYYDNYDGQTKLFTAARCGTHDLRGGIYQNRINSVHNNNSSHGVYLDIWRNAGYWEVFDYVYPYEGRNVYSNDIDRIRIEC